MKPEFYEHEEDPLIPPGYGIDASHDGGFYPYRLVDGIPVYLTWAHNGLDVRRQTYEEAREYLAEVVD